MPHPASDTPADLTWRHAAQWAAAASAVMLSTYFVTNWLTSHRADVGTLHFDWELRIPLVPAMIVPYMSIDLLYVAAFFFCVHRAELRAHSIRCILAAVVAAVCFLLFPLTTGWPRQSVDGLFGPLFQLLHLFDPPHNLAPSLHIAHLALVACIYHRRTRGLVNGALHAWFILIALSTLLTHQHHVIDIVTGLLLAVACLYAVPDRPLSEAELSRAAA